MWHEIWSFATKKMSFKELYVLEHILQKNSMQALQNMFDEQLLLSTGKWPPYSYHL
jgi:hypothetical protein